MYNDWIDNFSFLETICAAQKDAEFCESCHAAGVKLSDVGLLLHRMIDHPSLDGHELKGSLWELGELVGDKGWPVGLLALLSSDLAQSPDSEISTKQLFDLCTCFSRKKYPVHRVCSECLFCGENGYFYKFPFLCPACSFQRRLTHWFDNSCHNPESSRPWLDDVSLLSLLGFLFSPYAIGLYQKNYNGTYEMLASLGTRSRETEWYVAQGGDVNGTFRISEEGTAIILQKPSAKKTVVVLTCPRKQHVMECGVDLANRMIELWL